MKVSAKIYIPEIIREFEKRAKVHLPQEDWNYVYNMITQFEEQQIEKALSYLTPKTPWE